MAKETTTKIVRNNNNDQIAAAKKKRKRKEKTTIHPPWDPSWYPRQKVKTISTSAEDEPK